MFVSTGANGAVAALVAVVIAAVGFVLHIGSKNEKSPRLRAVWGWLLKKLDVKESVAFFRKNGLPAVLAAFQTWLFLRRAVI